MKFNKSWLVPGLVGVGIGYLLSNHLSSLLPISPLAYQGRLAPHRVPRASGGGAGGISHIGPSHPVHTTFVPVRRSFDRSYDSWLHTTVNSLPTIG